MPDSAFEATLPPSWQSQIGAELQAPSFQSLKAFVAGEREKHEVFPPPSEVFTAFELAPYGAVKVVLLGPRGAPKTVTASLTASSK